MYEKLIQKSYKRFKLKIIIINDKTLFSFALSKHPHSLEMLYGLS